MPPYNGLWPNDRNGIANIREKPIEPDEDRAICNAWPDPLRQMSTQNIELMVEDRHLRFKPSARLETVE